MATTPLPSLPRVRPEALIEMVHTAAQRLNRHEDLEQLLHDVVDLCLEGLAGDSCFVYLLEASTGELILSASSNSHPEEVGRLCVRIGEGITGWVAQQRRPVAIAAQAWTDSRFKFYSALPEDRYEAFLSVPILFRNVVLGVINLQHRAVHEHDGLEIKALASIALMLGEALDRARHIYENEESARRLNEFWALSELLGGDLGALMPRVLEQIAQATRAVSVSLRLLGEREPQAAAWAAPGHAAEAISDEELKLAETASGPIVLPGRGLLSSLPLRTGIAGCLLCVYPVSEAPPVQQARFQGLLARELAGAVERAELAARCDQQERALSDRKVIERAKGVLQRERNLSEDEAYRLLQQESRRNRRPMAAVAQALLTSRALRSATGEEGLSAPELTQKPA